MLFICKIATCSSPPICNAWAHLTPLPYWDCLHFWLVLKLLQLCRCVSETTNLLEVLDVILSDLFVGLKVTSAWTGKGSNKSMQQEAWGNRGEEGLKKEIRTWSLCEHHGGICTTSCRPQAKRQAVIDIKFLRNGVLNMHELPWLHFFSISY